MIVVIPTYEPNNKLITLVSLLKKQSNCNILIVDDEKLLVKGIHMVEPCIRTNGRLNAVNGRNQSLSFLPAYNRAHKRIGIHR